MAIELISKIKPKNGKDFPLVDAIDVQVWPDGKRLDSALPREFVFTYDAEGTGEYDTENKALFTSLYEAVTNSSALYVRVQSGGSYFPASLTSIGEGICAITAIDCRKSAVLTIIFVYSIDTSGELIADEVSYSETELIFGDDNSDSVKYTAQTLTDEQKAQARENIGTPSVSELEGLEKDMEQYAELVNGQLEKAVTYVEQALTDEQKAQARTNIGAVSSEEINEMAKGLTIENLGGIPAPETAKEGQFLVYTDGAWSAATVPTWEGGSY